MQNFAMNEASKMGISQLVRVSEKLGFACLTKNNLPAAILFPLAPEKEAIDHLADMMRKQHETKRLSMEQEVLASPDFYRSYLQDFLMLAFACMNEFKISDEILKELTDELFRFLENAQKLFPNAQEEL